VGVLQKLVQRRTTDLHPADAMIYVLLHDLVAALSGEPAKIEALGFRMLINS
jgi:hypothetical protein